MSITLEGHETQAADTVSGACDIATATIRSEHHSLSMVLEAIQRMLADIARGYAEPDFGLLAAALYYIDDFPERCHHPKEDEHLFRAIRRRTKIHDAALDELQAEHVRSAQMMSYLHRALVHYQGGAPQGLDRFSDAVKAYSAMLSDHMRKEETLLDWARQGLTEAEWRQIAAAFDANDDPLFGKNRRDEFRLLYLGVVNRLPRKLRLQLQRRGRAE